MKEIEQFAFSQCGNLKTVYMGSGLVDVGYNAFNYCESLERVEISDLASWCGIAFHYNGSASGWFGPHANPLSYAGHLYLNGNEVVDLVIPEEVTSIHGDLNFYGCVGLKSVTFPDDCNVEYIGAHTFSGCENIETLKLNKHLKRIYECAFSGCKLIESLVIPNEVTLIGSAAFNGCTNLKELTLGNSLEVIEAGFWGPAFGGTSITEIIVPEKIENLNGFWNSKVRIVNIDQTSLTEIYGSGKDAVLPIERINITDLATFMGIKKQLGGYDLYLNGNLVEDLAIPSSVSEIGEKGMQGCKSLKSITIPSHVKTINDNAFNGCYYIETITFEGGSPTIGKDVFGTYNNTYIISRMQEPSDAPNGIINECQRRNILCVPAGCKETYETAEGWSTFRYIVEASGPEEAFLDRGNLYRIYGDEVTLIKGGYSAYWGYYLPETATYQEKTYPITVIGGEVHDGYSPDIVIYAPVKAIAEKAFASCTGVNSVTSYIKEPFAINSNVFNDEVKQGITLFVPYGTKAKYQATDGWKEYATIIEMGEAPMTDPEPYVVYNDGMLTFYCDNQRSNREGTTYDLNEGSNAPGWLEHKETITKAVFDASFANSRPTSTCRWFENCESLTEILGINNLNTEEVTGMEVMFYYCKNLKAIDVSNFNTEKVTSMSQMFDGCRSLTSLDVSKFKTDKVKYMGSMFSGCSSLTSLDVSGFNTSKLSYMSYLFDGCSSLTSLDVSHFNTEKVKSMYCMFSGCSSLISLDVSHFDTRNVENMHMMFDGCRSLTMLDVSNFNTDNVTEMYCMFSRCSSLTNLDVSNFNTENVTNMAGMFMDCENLSSLDVINFNTDKVTSMARMFYGCSNLVSLDLSSFVTSALADKEEYTGATGDYGIQDMFSNCRKLSKLTLGNGFTTKEELKCGNVFTDCSSLDRVVFTGDIPATINSQFFSGVGTAEIPVTLTVPEQYLANYEAEFTDGMFYSGYFVLSSDETPELKDGDVFTATTKWGVDMTFKVISAKDKTCQVGSGDENASAVDKDYNGMVTIPDEVNGFTVTEIAGNAFVDCNFLLLEFPAELTAINAGALLRCQSLKYIIIPRTVKYIAPTAFVSCTGVETILVEIENEAYDSREKCNAIIRKEDNALLRGCKNTVIPSGVERINFAAFQWTPFEGDVVIPEGVTEIDQSAFVRTTMSSISLPSTLTYIGGWSFQDCDGLTTIDIPEGVTAIGDYAFSFCDNVREITIPASVTEMGEKAFYEMSGLESVISLTQNPKAIRDDVFTNYSTATLTVPYGTKEAYQATNGWKNFLNIVEADLTPAGGQDEDEIVKGDVNGDGSIDIADAVCIVTLNPECNHENMVKYL